MAPRGRGTNRPSGYCRVCRGRGGRGRRMPRRGGGPPSAVVQTSRRRGVNIQVLRELNLFVKPVVGVLGKAIDWLSLLKDFGLLALKLFIIAVVGEGSAPSSKSYPVGATQTVLIGADDMIAKHAFVEYEKDTSHAYVDYRLARLHQLHILVTAGAKLAERAGRYAMALVEMSLEEVEEMKLAEGWVKTDSYSFQEILQIPGAKTAPFGTPLRMTWKPSANSFGRRTLSLGTASRGTSVKALGGYPVIKLVVGYEDFASESGTVDSMYNSTESLVTITIRGSMTLTEPGKRYIRTDPIIGSALRVGVACPGSSGQFLYEVDYEDLRIEDGQLMVDTQALLASKMRIM